MDFNDFVAQSQGLQPQSDTQKVPASSSPSKKGMEETSFPHMESQYDDDLLKELDKKHSELSTFLDDIPPSGSAGIDKDRMSVSPQDLDSPNAEVPRRDVTSNIASNQSGNLMDDDDPFGLNLSGSNQNDRPSKPEEISFGKVNGKTEGEGNDTKLLQDLLDQANNFGGDISPDSLHTDDLLGLDKSPSKSSTNKDDQVVPPLPQSGLSNFMTDDSLFHLESSSPMQFEEPKLPEGPCFKPPSPVNTSVRQDSPKLPETPCFKPPSPEVTMIQANINEPQVTSDGSAFEPDIVVKTEPEVMICPSKPHPIVEDRYDPDFTSAETDEKEYTRRETMTFDNEEDLIEKKKDAEKFVQEEFGGGDLPPSPRKNVADKEGNVDVPPPIPKHSWELEKEIPPPIPPHSVTTDYSTAPPKFYESEDSSSKTDAPADEMENAQTEPDRNLELQEFDEAIPESIEESGTPASDSGSSKIEVLEIKPTVKADLESVTKQVEVEETKREAHVVQPKQKIEVDTGAFELSEEMQLLLNTLKPRTWFDPSKLHPVVSELVYWRDPKKSGGVFGAIFVVLLALSLMSLISVVAYTSLAVLSGTFAFRVYKSVLQAVQKTQDGHPFKEYLDLDVAIPGDKAQELSNAIINYANSAILQLRRLFLVEDLVDSAKFGLVLYLLTYIGGWFNGLTLLILGFVALFSLPKVYETNKTVIDQYLELINSKISEVTAKVTTAVPFLKKEKAQ